jgi:aspartyl-tRNA synthetase
VISEADGYDLVIIAGYEIFEGSGSIRAHDMAG